MLIRKSTININTWIVLNGYKVLSIGGNRWEAIDKALALIAWNNNLNY